MGPVKKFVAAGLTALALSGGADAALFVTYGTGGSGLTTLSATSDALDFGGVFSSFTIDSTLGLTVSSLAATTVTTLSEGLQTVQGCAFAAGSCTPGDWFDIIGKGLSLGGASFTQTITPTETKSFGTGSLLVTGTPVQSLRLKWNADSIDPPAGIGVTGSLMVTAIPEPGVWAMMLAGILGIAGIARRRLA